VEVLSALLWRCTSATAIPCVQKRPVLLLVSTAGSHIDAEALELLKAPSWGVKRETRGESRFAVCQEQAV